ncbi:putative dehydrogenase [Methylobacterium sp. PvR107]|nr:putative dehydrogenase [Methylobacterium sp. PvR107]
MGAFASDVARQWLPSDWFPLTHAEAILDHPSLDLAAIVDSDASKLSVAQARYGCDGFSGFEEMLDVVKPELVCIATRTPGRAALIKRCVRAGVKAIHVEKPLCNSVLELNELEAELSSEQIFLTIGALRRHLSPYLTALDFVTRGDLGKLREIRVGFGPGPLYWTHPHSVDLMLWAARPQAVLSVQARLDKLDFDKSSGVVLNDPIVLNAVIEFKDGIIGHISQSGLGELTLECQDGAVVVENDGWVLKSRSRAGDDPYPHWKSVTPSRTSPFRGTTAALQQLVSCLKDDIGARSENSALKAEIFLGQRLLFGIIASHLEGGRPLRLSEIPQDLAVEAMTGGRPA